MGAVVGEACMAIHSVLQRLLIEEFMPLIFLVFAGPIDGIHLLILCPISLSSLPSKTSTVKKGVLINGYYYDYFCTAIIPRGPNQDKGLVLGDVHTYRKR